MGIFFQKTKLWKNSCREMASYVFKTNFIQHSWREQNRESMLNINSCRNTWWNRVQNPSFRFMLVTRCVNSQSQRGGWNMCSKSTGGKLCVATWPNDDGNEGWNEGLLQYGSNVVNLDDSILPLSERGTSWNMTSNPSRLAAWKTVVHNKPLSTVMPLMPLINSNGARKAWTFRHIHQFLGALQQEIITSYGIASSSLGFQDHLYKLS